MTTGSIAWRPRSRARVRDGLVLVAMLLALVACDPAGSAGSAPARAPIPTASPTAEAVAATLRWAVREPAGVVPSAVVDDAGLVIVDALFDSLTTLAADGRVLPAAAARWSQRSGGREWQFVLRDGAQFSDGTPVKAQDFAAAWSLVIKEGRTGSHLQDVAGYREVRDGSRERLAGLRAIDDATLDVRLRTPNMEFPALVAHPSLAPLPPTASRDGVAFAVQPIGNGPYRMAEPWVRGQFIRVARAEQWHNGPSVKGPQRVHEIVFRFRDPSAAYVGFQQGRIDVAPVPAGALDQARRTYGRAAGAQGPGVVDVPKPSLYFLGLGIEQPPWDEVELRRALSRAIDRRALVAAESDQALDVARSIVTPALPGAGRVFCDSCLHLPSLAGEAFERAGIDEVTLTYDAGGGHEQIVERLQRDLAEVGVRLVGRALPFDQYLAALEAGKLSLFRFGWQAQYPSAGAMLEPLVGSGAPHEAGDGANYGGYASPQVDRLLEQARMAESTEERQALWAQAETIALREQAIVPLFSFRLRTVISDRVQDLTLTPWGTATPEQARVVAEPKISD